MKKLIFALTLLGSLPVIACVETNRGNAICSGQQAIVLQSNNTSYKGIVKTVNLKTNKIGIVSTYGYITVHNIDEVQAESGCVEDICVGDFATATNALHELKVIAVNSKTKMIGVVDLYYGHAFSYSADDVQVSRKCEE